MDYEVVKEQQRRPYFDAKRDFETAVKERRFTQALKFLRTGLPLTVSAVTSLKAEWGASNPSIPFLGPTAGAIAALFNDSEVFDLMESAINSLNYVAKTGVERYRQDAQLVSNIRATLAIHPEATVAELKRTLSREDRGRISRLLSWMEKNQELSLTKDGKTTIVRMGEPAVKPLISFPTFRADAAAEPTRNYSFPYIDKPRLPYDEQLSRTERFNAAKVFSDFKEFPLPPDRRQPGVMETHLLREGIWLIGTSRSKPDGSYLTPIVVLTHAGETIRKLDLKHKVMRVFSSYERNDIIILDSVLGVHVYSFEGSEVRGFSLNKNPEFLNEFAIHDAKPKATAVVRSVDVSPKSGDVAFSAYDKVWRFTSDGDPKLALQMYPVAGLRNEREANRASVPGNATTVQVMPTVSTTVDWVYYVRFSEIDDSVFVGTYSGHLIKVSRNGKVESKWQLDGPVVNLLEDVEHTIAPTYNSVNILKETGDVEKVEAGGSAFVKDAYTARRQLREIGIVDHRTLEVTRYLMNRDVKAVYPSNGALRVDMTTTYAELALPQKLSHPS